MTNYIQALYDCVQTRPRPEDVAELVLEALEHEPILVPEERLVLNRAATHSFKRMGRKYSSMAADFARPQTGLAKNAATVSTLFGVQPLTAEQALDPDALEAYVRIVSKVIGKTFGESGKAQKLTKPQRRAIGLFKTTRWYNKRWRLLCRMEEKLKKHIFNQRRYLFTRVGKSGLAVEIPRDDFAADIGTACLVAYLASRMSLRSTFTNKSQERAYDEVSEALLRRCETSTTTRWDVVAYLMPDARVLGHLSDDAKGRMLGRWWALLVDIADMLEQIHTTTPFNRAEMIVSRGNDSSTWNQVAGGWNKARDQWVSVLYAMGLESMLDAICPGKVMRLMAADVARWHKATGGDVHPGTKVWAKLPPPWEVVRGRAACGRTLVEEACRSSGVAPEEWTGAKRDRVPVLFRPTPELVHGVSVSSPELATALKKAGVFSGKVGKGIAPPVVVERDDDGFALHASEPETVEPSRKTADDSRMSTVVDSVKAELASKFSVARSGNSS